VISNISPNDSSDTAGEKIHEDWKNAGWQSLTESKGKGKTKENDKDILQFCIKIILKEAKEEDKVVKQILYTMLSAYTNNPINLAINSPSGEGKTYVIQKVGEKFPKEDMMFLAGMTDKALFHRQGTFIVTNEQTGEHEPLDKLIGEIDSQIEDKELEITITKDPMLREGLKAFIDSLEEDKKELKKRAKKLIDLSHRTLVFLDSPRPELFSALMPLLSHDRYEVEYEFVDTTNGIRTKTNILRGWPAVIFAQALDYSHYQRYPEIQRRFIITNPKMSAEKYAHGVDLICDRFGLPDFAYQAKVVNDLDKEKTREIIKDIKHKMLEACERVKPGKNNVIIPYMDTIKKSLPKQRAFDMTTTNRIGGFLSLLPLVNADKRPRLVVKNKNEPGFLSQVIPFALFEDLQETMCLMEYANGVRPYILEWYNDVFLEVYNSKKTEDSKFNSRGELLTEKVIAVTTRELIDKTFEVQKKKLSTQQILQTFIRPLVNENIIDNVPSEIDKRARIYFPVAISPKKYNKLFISEEMSNFSQQPVIPVEDSILYPDKEYIISKISDILNYSSNSDLIVEIQDHGGKTITVEELTSQYYPKPEDYFESTNKFHNNTLETRDPDEHNEQAAAATNQQNKSEENRSQMQTEKEARVCSTKSTFPDEYLQTEQINDDSHENSSNNTKNESSEQQEPTELFTSAKMNNLSYSPIIPIAEFFNHLNGESLPKHNLEQSPCYPIIDKKKIGTMNQTIYLCKIHRDVWSIDIEFIESHCKNHEPDRHKAAIFESLSINNVAQAEVMKRAL
jgi:hypothetical protein